MYGTTMKKKVVTLFLTQHRHPFY